MPFSDTVGTVNSGLATLSRLGRGIYVRAGGIRPEKSLELYDIENCRYCRLVREALTELDLDTMVYPCPKGGRRFRPRAIELGGRARFPFLVDQNTGRSLYESADIVAYLFETYGCQPLPWWWRLRGANLLSSGVASLYRAGAGGRARLSRSPHQPLELYSFESSPFARRVREVLCELELPYLLHNVGRTQARESLPPGVRSRLRIKVAAESENRKAFEARAGRIMVPYLVDPNTGTAMFESAAICEYLLETYGDAAGGSGSFAGLPAQATSPRPQT